MPSALRTSLNVTWRACGTWSVLKSVNATQVDLPVLANVGRFSHATFGQSRSNVFGTLIIGTHGHYIGQRLPGISRLGDGNILRDFRLKLCFLSEAITVRLLGFTLRICAGVASRVRNLWF